MKTATVYYIVCADANPDSQIAQRLGVSYGITFGGRNPDRKLAESYMVSISADYPECFNWRIVERRK